MKTFPEIVFLRGNDTVFLRDMTQNSSIEPDGQSLIFSETAVKPLIEH